MNQLSSKSTKQAANDKVLLLVQEGSSQDEASVVVSEETGRSAAAIKSYFHWHGGHSEGTHGNCKLTKEEENQLISMLIVFSMMHEAISIKGLQEFVETIFGEKIGKSWAGDFIKRHQDELSLRKTKLLAKKRVDDTITQNVASFIVSMEGLMEEFAYVEDSYDKTQVFIADEGGVMIEKVGKERAQHRGVRGQTIGSLLSFIGANGIVMMSVWIFSGKRENDNEEKDNNQQLELLNVNYTLPEL